MRDESERGDMERLGRLVSQGCHWHGTIGRHPVCDALWFPRSSQQCPVKPCSTRSPNLDDHAVTG